MPVQGCESFDVEFVSIDGKPLAAKECLPLLLVNIQEQFTMIAREPLSLFSGDGGGQAHEKAASAI